MFMNQQDFIGIGSDGMAIIFTSIQTEPLFRLIALGLTILSVALGIGFKIYSLVKNRKTMSDDEKDKTIKSLQEDLATAQSTIGQMQNAVKQVQNIAGRVIPTQEKKGA